MNPRDSQTKPPAGLLKSLSAMGLAGGDEEPGGQPLAGGVSSDIWRIDLPSGPICVKRALDRLKVAADWRVSTERNLYEMRWFLRVFEVEPDAVPQVLGHDEAAGAFAMAFLSPEKFKVWKEELRAGRVDPAFAGEVGRRLAHIHSATAGKDAVQAEFGTDDLFHAIRLEPYLEATARVHEDLAPALMRLVEVTAGTRLALVHGDVSPKNILVGPRGPVFIDAECAWYGDPAFDVAFCLNHLLLKCLWVPGAAERLIAAFRAFCDAYLAGVDWEPPTEIEARVAHLLPGLMLARIDGKSPAEYITAEDQKILVRQFAREKLADPVDTLSAVAEAWQQELAH